ncbi:MAG: 50S ribosomal protein L4 [Kiritimatiellae bacterium]|nr:50S ribosomal protein L4 [Kiritimatiellia bacterium]
MSKLPVRNMKGESAGEFDLADDLLVLNKGAQVVHDAVVAYRANRRAGTASTLTKAEVAGTGAKPWRQKGTGRARAGYRQSPIWRGGGVAFGPKPRKYTKKLSKKAARLAFRRAFSDKVSAGQVVVIEDLSLAEPKTRPLAELLGKLGAQSGALLVVDQVARNLQLAARNLERVEVVTGKDVNTYQVLRYPLVLVTREGMARVQQRLKAEGGKA